ncbi:MAG TPA: hypothetical protein VIU61_30490 [Kofleriaceae bacterium]
MRWSFKLAIALGLAGCVDFDAKPRPDAAVRPDSQGNPTVDAAPPDAVPPTVDAKIDGMPLVEQ